MRLLLAVAFLAAALLFIGCSGESGPTLPFKYPLPTNLTVTGTIKLSDVAVSPALGGINPSFLDYSPFRLTVQDDSSVTGEADVEGRFSLNPMSIRDQYVIFCKNSRYPGFVLEYMAADSRGLYGEHHIEISIRTTAQSMIARCLRDRYGRRIDPSALTATHIDSTVKAIADVLERHPEKLAGTTLDQVAEIKAAYTSMAESLNAGGSGVVPNKWVLMFYLAGDNNLAGFITDNITDIEKAGVPSGTQILIQADFPVHGLKRMMLREGKLEELATVASVDTTSGAVIADFIAWSKRSFPASDYALIISSHADGWKNHLNVRTSLISDDTSGTRGNPVEIAAYVKGANSTFDGYNRPLSLLVFDACSMASIEIAYEFKDCAAWSVFSQAFVPGNGFPYGDIVTSVKAIGAEKIDAEEMGKIFCSKYRDKYLNGLIEQPVTVSMVKNAEMSNLVVKLETYLGKIFANIAKLGPVIANLRDSKTTTGEEDGAQVRYVVQAYEMTDYRDMRDFIEKARNSMPEVAIEGDLVLENLSNVVRVNYFSRRNFPDTHGLSISLPDKKTYTSSYISPESLKYYYYQFAQQTSWDEILAAINAD
ncbi:MAG: hypothetical protein Kow0029_12760 [Candidatus Rifleibacteriota bacterium]